MPSARRPRRARARLLRGALAAHAFCSPQQQVKSQGKEGKREKGEGEREEGAFVGALAPGAAAASFCSTPPPPSGGRSWKGGRREGRRERAKKGSKMEGGRKGRKGESKES
jgi:hypothetical protein